MNFLNSKIVGVCALLLSVGLQAQAPIYNPSIENYYWDAFQMTVPTQNVSATLPLAEARVRKELIAEDTECTGTVAPGSSIRFFVDGTAPTATTGIIAPAPVYKDTHVVERTISIVGKKELLGFKATSANSTEGVVQWQCFAPGH